MTSINPGWQFTSRIIVLLFFLPLLVFGQGAKPEELFKQALQLEQEGRWQDAKANYLQVIEKKPKYGEAHYRLGLIYLERYQEPESIRLAIPRLEAARANRYDVNKVEPALARAHFLTGSYASAIEIYRLAIERRPKQADLRRALAEVYLASGNDEEAFVEDSIALLLESKNPDGWLLDGRIAVRRREYDRAKADYRRVIAADPKRKEAYEALAELFKATQVDSAIHYYKRYLELDPNDADVNFNLSGLYYQLSQKDLSGLTPPTGGDSLAMRAYVKTRDSLNAIRRAAYSESAFVYVGRAIDAGFSREDVYDFYVKVAQAARKRAASIKALQAFIEINPRDAMKWALLGQVWSDSGDIQQALLCYKKVTELDSLQRRRVYAWIAQQYYKLKQYDSSITYYTRVIELDPKAASAYFSRGYAYVQKGLRAQGMSDLEKGLTFDVRRIEPRVYLMTMHWEDKNYNRAYELAKAILELDPDNAQAKAVKKNIEIMRAPKRELEEEE